MTDNTETYNLTIHQVRELLKEKAPLIHQIISLKKPLPPQPTPNIPKEVDIDPTVLPWEKWYKE